MNIHLYTPNGTQWRVRYSGKDAQEFLLSIGVNATGEAGHVNVIAQQVFAILATDVLDD